MRRELATAPAWVLSRGIEMAKTENRIPHRKLRSKTPRPSSWFMDTPCMDGWIYSTLPSAMFRVPLLVRYGAQNTAVPPTPKSFLLVHFFPSEPEKTK